MSKMHRREAVKGTLASLTLLPILPSLEPPNSREQKLRMGSNILRRRFTCKGVDLEEVIIQPYNEDPDEWYICWCFYPFESLTTPLGNKNWLVHYQRSMLCSSQLPKDLEWIIARRKIEEGFNKIHAEELG